MTSLVFDIWGESNTDGSPSNKRSHNNHRYRGNPNF